MKRYLLAVAIITSGLVAAVYDKFYQPQSVEFRCSGDYIERRATDDGKGTELKIKMTTFLKRDGHGALLQKGELLKNGVIYIVNRDIDLIYEKLDNKGVHAIKFEKISKRKSDNTPSSLSNEFPILGEMPNTIYVNVTSFNGQAYLFNELSTPYFICDKS